MTSFDRRGSATLSGLFESQRRIGLAAGQSPRKGGIFDDIEAWVDDRKAAAEQLARNAEAAGRKAWDEATQSRPDVLAGTRSGAGASRPSGRLEARSWLDRNSAAKILEGDVAQTAGNVAGLGRGVWHSVEGAGRGAYFAYRLTDPFDAAFSAPGDSAADQLLRAGKNAFDYAKEGIADPGRVATDIKNAGLRFYVGIDPNATPMANTFGGEMARRFNVGANQGELAWDGGSLLFGAGLAPKMLRGLDAAAETGGAAKFVDQGFSPAVADYLAKPYEGKGHHFVPRNAWKPIQLPQPLSDSPFNVLKPDGMNRGDFYELHYAVDPRFYAARLPRAVGGGAWNGKVLALPKYPPLSRVWYGSPAPLKSAVGVASTSGAAADTFNGDP